MNLKKKGNKTMKTMQQLYENKKLSFEDLASVKHDLKLKIDKKQDQVFDSAKRLVPFTKDSSTLSLKKSSFSPLSLITTPIRKGKTISIVEGIVVGYKLVRNIRKFIKR